MKNNRKYYNVGILLFEEVEVLDFAGPFEVFSVTRYEDQTYDTNEKTPFSVETVSETGEIVNCRHGLKVKPDRSFADSQIYDIIVVPGGLGVRKQLNNPQIIEWIIKQNTNTLITTSVCTGALLLAKAGLLQGKEATTHYENLHQLHKKYPEVTVRGDQKFVDEGNIITSAGISAGIEMALHMVGKLVGPDISQKTKKFMEYGI